MAISRLVWPPASSRVRTDFSRKPGARTRKRCSPGSRRSSLGDSQDSSAEANRNFSGPVTFSTRVPGRGERVRATRPVFPFSRRTSRRASRCPVRRAATSTLPGSRSSKVRSLRPTAFPSSVISAPCGTVRTSSSACRSGCPAAHQDQTEAPRTRVESSRAGAEGLETGAAAMVWWTSLHGWTPGESPGLLLSKVHSP